MSLYSDLLAAELELTRTLPV